MQFLAHRGVWRAPSEQNTNVAFQRAWTGRFGVETDVRDLSGKAVISHDPPRNDAQGLEEFLLARTAHSPETPLALNIKADGLAAEIKRLVELSTSRNFFVFDMSVPDTLHYFRAELPVFVRLSEYEPQSSLVERAVGIWLDAFETEWWGLDTMRQLTARGKQVAIVSPELHRRPHEAVWQLIESAEATVKDKILLCTDFPDAAERFFAG
jgi:glycerophosphoryl diester phosphodiesterase